MPTRGMAYTDLMKKREIVFHSKELSDENLEVLAEVVRNTEVLEELNLSCNRIALADGRFAEALAHNDTLRVLYLNQNKIRAEGAKQLASALKNNETLQTIGLDGNQIGDIGAMSLSKALKVNASLLEMSISANDIGYDGAQSLAASLKDNNTLRSLRLRGNKICEGGSQVLADALEHNHSIQSLFINGSRCPKRDGEGINHASTKIQTILEDPKRRTRHLEAIVARQEEILAANKEELERKDAEIAKKDARIALLRADHEFESHAEKAIAE